MKYQITLKAIKAVELLSKLNKNEFFEVLNEDDLYSINTVIATRAIEMLVYDLTNENREPLVDTYNLDLTFNDVRAISDFWCIFSKYDFYNDGCCVSRYGVAQRLWQSAGSNNFEFEDVKIRKICLTFGEKMRFECAGNEGDYDLQESLMDEALDRYTSSIEIVGEAFYKILRSLDLLTIKELTE